MNIIWFNVEVRFGYPLTCPRYGCEQKYYDRKLRDLPNNVWPFGAYPDLDLDHHQDQDQDRD